LYIVQYILFHELNAFQYLLDFYRLKQSHTLLNFCKQNKMLPRL